MRTEFERRPALLLLVGLIVGLTAATFLPNWLFVIAALIYLRSHVARICIALAFCGGVLIAPGLPVRPLSSPEAVNGLFSVVSPPTRILSGGSTFQVDGGRERFEVSSLVLVPDLGDEVSIQGTARPLPEGFARTYLSQGVTGEITPASAEITVVKRAGGLMAAGSRWRESFLEFSRSRLNEEDAGVVSALAFDVRTGLSLSNRDALEQSGTVHLLAASGLQLLTLMWFLEFLLQRLPLQYLVRQTIILSLGCLFVIAGGIHPGTFRAWVSTALRDGAIISGNSFDGLSSIGIAGLLYLLWRPAMVYSPGFQLSMTLGAGISMFRAYTPGQAFLPRLAKGAFTTWLFSLPIVAYLFGIVSFVAIPANLIAGALVPVCFLGLLASHAASFVSDWLSQAILVPAVLAAHGLEVVVRGLGLCGAWGFHVSTFNGYWLIPIYGSALVFWKPKERPVS